MLKSIFKYAIRMIKPAYFLFLCLNIPVQLFSSIVVIEGMTGAGKSSSIVSLYPQLSIKFFVLPELNPEPSPDFKNKSMQEQAEDYYHLWLRRMKIVKQSNIDFLFDRSYFGSLAFTYAMDKLARTNLYLPLIEKMRTNFDFQKDFDRIIILDVSPAVSIERRKNGGMDNYWPWNDISFLEYFREFYLLELPKLTTREIEYINTTDLLQSELRIILQNKLKLTETEGIIAFSQKQKDLLIDYIDTHNLGRLRSNPIFLFGCLSIITETRCVQLDENNHPILLDNDRLYHLLLPFSDPKLLLVPF